MAGYELMNIKWGQGALGTSGGQVTWSFATTVGSFYSFDTQISDATYQRLVREAFNAWEAVANIDFVEVADSASSKIRLGWDYIDGAFDTVGEARSRYFEGDIGTFSKAEIRFDTAENWTTGYVDLPNTVNFFAVAQHEIGHAIGLGHTDDENTLMYPFQNQQIQLSPGDIAGAQALYGANTNAPGGTSYNGTAGNDTYIGKAAAEQIFGNGGSDYLVGLGGNDVIDGESGIDFAGFAGDVDDYTVYRRSNGHIEVLDTADRFSEGRDDLVNVERLEFNDGYLAFDLDGTAGDAFRLYQAAFDRLPDIAGLGYWIRALDAGQGDLAWMAANFISSNEFRTTYGSPSTVSNGQFLALLYENVLDRTPDQAGYDFWVGRMNGGHAREDVLVDFSDSAENKANVAGAIQDGIWYV